MLSTVLCNANFLKGQLAFFIICNRSEAGGYQNGDDNPIYSIGGGFSWAGQIAWPCFSPRNAEFHRKHLLCDRYKDLPAINPRAKPPVLGGRPVVRRGQEVLFKALFTKNRLLFSFSLPTAHTIITVLSMYINDHK